MNVLTLADLKLAIKSNEDLSEKLSRATVPAGPIDFDTLTVDEFFSVGLTLYYKSQVDAYEQGYFWKANNNGLTAIVGFTHNPNGLFITTLGGVEGFE